MDGRRRLGVSQVQRSDRGVSCGVRSAVLGAFAALRESCLSVVGARQGGAQESRETNQICQKALFHSTLRSAALAGECLPGGGC